jgi:hypothetical protein
VSVLAIVLIVIAAVLAVFVLGGLVVARRRRNRPGFEQHIAQADQALERARAEDKGWDRELLQEAARRALASLRPGAEASSLHLVLVDDRPGVEEDRAHFVADVPEGRVQLVLARAADGSWGIDPTA